MSLTARDIGIACLAHCNLDIDGSLPTGCLTYLAQTINRALEEMRKEAKMSFKRPVFVQWKASSTGTVTVTHNARSITFGSLATPIDGTSLLITGDSAYNEVAYDAGTDTSLLLLPYS